MKLHPLEPLIALVHEHLAYDRRVKTLAQHLAHLLPPDASVLDVGCGDGVIDSLILSHRSDLQLEGVDVLLRPNAKIPVQQFDGVSLPFEDGAFKVVMLVDVIHHAEHPHRLLAEACRVAQNALVIKDHLLSGKTSYLKLRLMDWLGNARYNVNLPYAYWTLEQWQETFEELGLETTYWEKNLQLYKQPIEFIFGRNLHFIARLDNP